MLICRFLFTVAAVVAGLSAASSLAAQDSSLQLATVKPGARVRVWSRSRSYTGTLVSRDAGSIRVEVWNEASENETSGPESQKSVMVLPSDSVTLMEVSAGHTTHIVEGVFVGGVVGVPLGLGFVELGNSLCVFNCNDNRPGRGEVIGAVVGGLIGLIVGISGSEHWVPAGPAALQVTPQPRGRLGLGLSLRF